MQGKLISTVLVDSIVLDKRLQNAIDQWQKLMPGALLRAALLPTDDAINDIQKIQSALDIDNPIHRQLLPQLHSNISRQLPKDIAAASKKLRLESLVRNNVYLKELQELAFLFAQESLPILALKGAALAPLYYKDIGCRPMGDLDVLVREHDLRKAIDLIIENGWTAVMDKSGQQQYITPRFNHAFSFEHPDKCAQLDLHVHCYHSALWRNIDEPFWQNSLPHPNYEGVLCLSDTDNLMHVCNHGVAQNHHAPVRWAMDAYQIIANGNIDWDWVSVNAKRTLIAPQLLTAFTWLQQELNVDIPAKVLTELGNTKYHRHAVSAWRYRLDTPIGFRQIVSSHWHRFRLPTKSLSMNKTISLIPSYLRNWAQRESLIVVAFEMVMKFIKIIFRRERS